MTYPHSSHHPIQSLSLFSSYLAAPLFNSCLRVAPYLSVLWADIIVCLNKVMVYCFSSFHLCNIMGCFQTTFQLYFSIISRFSTSVDKYCRQAVHWFSSTISCRTTGRTMWQDITFRTGHPGPHVSLMYCRRLTVLSLHSATSVSPDTSRLYHPGRSPSLILIFLRQWSITFRKFSRN